MTGRKPKTTTEKVAAGNPGKRKQKEVIVATPEGALICPEYFDAEEREVWVQTLKNAPFEVIKPADIEILVAFCQQVSMARQAMREMKQIAEDNRKADGSTTYMSVETERGWVKNPLVTVLDSTAKMIRSLGSELGLSPISRERLTPEKEGEKTLMELLSDPQDSTAKRPN